MYVQDNETLIFSIQHLEKHNMNFSKESTFRRNAKRQPINDGMTKRFFVFDKIMEYCVREWGEGEIVWEKSIIPSFSQLQEGVSSLRYSQIAM